MRYLLKWSAITIVGFLLLVGGIRLVSPRSDNFTQRVIGPNTDRRPDACWYDVCPGQTSASQSVDQLTRLAGVLAASISVNPTIEASGYLIPYFACIDFPSPSWRSCTRANYDSGKIQIDINVTNSGLRLGDIVAILGPPTSTFLCSGVVADITNADVDGGVSVTFQYSNGYTVSAYKVSRYNPPVYPVPGDEWGISPDMLVSYIEYYPLAAYSGGSDGEVTFPWRGFGKGPERQYSCGN